MNWQEACNKSPVKAAAWVNKLGQKVIRVTKSKGRFLDFVTFGKLIRPSCVGRLGNEFISEGDLPEGWEPLGGRKC